MPDVPQLFQSLTHSATSWRDFILFHNKRHPLEMGEPQFVDVLTLLVVPATHKLLLMVWLLGTG